MMTYVKIYELIYLKYSNYKYIYIVIVIVGGVLSSHPGT